MKRGEEVNMSLKEENGRLEKELGGLKERLEDSHLLFSLAKHEPGNK